MIGLDTNVLARYLAGFADFVVGLVARNEGADVTWTFDQQAAESGLFRAIGGSAKQRPG